MNFETNEEFALGAYHMGIEPGLPAPSFQSGLPEIHELDAAQERILSALYQKQAEFKRISRIDIDEARIKAEIQEILDMDARELDALERDVKARLAANRKKLAFVYK